MSFPYVTTKQISEILETYCYFCQESQSTDLAYKDDCSGFLDTNIVGACAWCAKMKGTMPSDVFIRRCSKVSWVAHEKELWGEEWKARDVLAKIKDGLGDL